MLKRYFDCCWLVGSIDCWNGMILERHTSKKKFSTIEFKDSINVSLYSLVVPSDDWSNTQFLEISLSRLSSHLIQYIGLSPVSVDK